MSKGSNSTNYRRLALASLIAASLAGCSTQSDNSQAPITAIGASGGAPAGSTQPAIVQPAPVASPVPSAPRSMAVQPISQPQPIASTPSSVPAQQAVTSQPVKLQNGKIVYNRNYGNIPKGSYSGSTYTVKRGDTLFYIAWITGNDFRDLAQKNNIAAPYGLSAGQVLQIGNGAGQPITGPNEN